MYRPTESQKLLRKHTLGPYGDLTLFSARTAAHKILLARLEGQNPAAAKDRIIAQHYNFAGGIQVSRKMSNVQVNLKNDQSQQS
jgi:hypothetical protein